MAANQNRCDLWLRQDWDRRLAGRQSLSAKALPPGATRRDASRIDRCGTSRRQLAVCLGAHKASWSVQGQPPKVSALHRIPWSPGGGEIEVRRGPAPWFTDASLNAY